MLNFSQKPRKSLGQNFLVDRNIIAKIISGCNLQKDDSILEIGPGPGQLTKEICPKVKSVIAIELDSHFCEKLRINFKFSNLQIICQDILKFDMGNIKSKIKVIGNLPYYISTPIISYLLSHKEKIGLIYISLQKELGERLVASPGGKEYGAFTCFVQYHTQPKILFKITKGCFKPQPKVDSVFMELKIREKPAVEVDEKLFFKIIHLAFSQRRKTISNALVGLFPKADLIAVLEKARINPQDRPERLSLPDFARFANLVAGFKSP
jgi:16S rRNA (adenine1518-N6/adenine1519-N6)-dimethyltransferase